MSLGNSMHSTASTAFGIKLPYIKMPFFEACPCKSMYTKMLLSSAMGKSLSSVVALCSAKGVWADVADAGALHVLRRLVMRWWPTPLLEALIRLQANSSFLLYKSVTPSCTFFFVSSVLFSFNERIAGTPSAFFFTNFLLNTGPVVWMGLISVISLSWNTFPILRSSRTGLMISIGSGGGVGVKFINVLADDELLTPPAPSKGSESDEKLPTDDSRLSGWTFSAR